MHYGFRDILSNMLIVWLIPIILLLLIGISIYMIGRNKKGDSQRTSNPYLKILNERFAKGEIDEEEYIRKKRNLSTFK
ncbi:MAG: SHOCT domain-containing protein [Gudongella sp.]|nr:SHOCT domain-containing protein [Gudongella sp.]